MLLGIEATDLEDDQNMESDPEGLRISGGLLCFWEATGNANLYFGIHPDVLHLTGFCSLVQEREYTCTESICHSHSYAQKKTSSHASLFLPCNFFSREW